MSATDSPHEQAIDIRRAGGSAPRAGASSAAPLPGVRCERCNTHWHPRGSGLMPMAGTTCPRCRARLR